MATDKSYFRYNLVGTTLNIIWGGVEKVKAFYLTFFFGLFAILLGTTWPNHNASVTFRIRAQLLLGLQANPSHPWSVLVLPICSKEPYFLQGKEAVPAGLQWLWDLSPRKNPNRCEAHTRGLIKACPPDKDYQPKVVYMIPRNTAYWTTASLKQNSAQPNL